jgi:hypothetical protein
MQELKLEPLKTLDFVHWLAKNIACTQHRRGVCDGGLDFRPIYPRVLIKVAPVEENTTDVTAKEPKGEEKVRPRKPPVVACPCC